MYNPNSSQRATAAPSIMSVLKAISDDKALVLFNNIALSNNDRYVPIKEMNLTTKQRQKVEYSPTLLGKIVYDSQTIIGKALSYYWKLKAIESTEMSSTDIPNEEKTQLINALIDNHQIKNVLMKRADVALI